MGVKGASPEGVWGEPTKASAEEGRRLMEDGVEASVKYITQTFVRIEQMRRQLGAG